jgi:hypothetical protein
MVKLDMTDCVEQFTVIGGVVNDGAATACVIGCRKCEESVDRRA